MGHGESKHAGLTTSTTLPSLSARHLGVATRSCSLTVISAPRGAPRILLRQRAGRQVPAVSRLPRSALPLT